MPNFYQEQARQITANLSIQQKLDLIIEKLEIIEEKIGTLEGKETEKPLTQKDVIRRVMEKEFQITPEAVSAILFSADPEKTLQNTLAYLERSNVLMVNVQHVRYNGFC